MDVSSNFNSAPSPTVAPYVDELMLSPAAGQSDNSTAKPTPVLMISPTPEPQPSLEIYRNENLTIQTPTPSSGVKPIKGNVGDILLTGVMILSAVVFIIGVIYAIKNSSTNHKIT